MVVEIDNRAASLLDTRLTRRLIQLELSDLDVPPDPSLSHGPRRVTLFFRVMNGRGEMFRVELWDHGEFCGARRVTGERGSPQLRSRRVALAAAELARRLHQRRLAAVARKNRKRKAAEDSNNNATAHFARLALAADALGAWVGPSQAWLAGTELSGELRFAGGAELALSSAWLTGELPDVPGSPQVRWFELGLSPSWVANLGASLDLDLGVTAAAAITHLSRVRAVDHTPGELDTWSARAAVHAYAEPRLARGLRLKVGPELGAVLRPIPIQDESGLERRISGLWLGASLGVVFDPSGPVK